MSLPNDILGALRSAAEPLGNAGIRDALGMEPGNKSATAIASSLNSLIQRGAVEREQTADGYRYHAVPGWTPAKRTGGVASVKGDTKAARAAKRQAKVAPAATVGVDVQADRVVVVDGGISAAEVMADVGKDKPPHSTIKPLAEREPAWPFQTVMLPRRTVRTLVAAVLTQCGDLSEELRQAVVDATREAA